MPQRDDFGYIDLSDWGNRIRLALSCRDSDSIPRVPDAGKFIKHGDVDLQVMHNGILVLKDGYIGPEQSLLTQLLLGVHEPQEEKVFSEVLPYMPAGATMVELGCWWAYYSLWFNKVVPDANNYCIEPDAINLEIGIKNFLLNGAEATFMQAGVAGGDKAKYPGDLPTKGNSIALSSGGRVAPRDWLSLTKFQRLIPTLTVDSFMTDQQLEFIDLLHVDIQLGEHYLLQASPKAFGEKRVGYVFISTHGLSWDMPGLDIAHNECLEMLRDMYGYHIVAEHSVSDSYSGDGLIVAKIPGTMGPDHVPVSLRSRSDFAYKPRS